jgi:Mn2+/Fe2+ NRAMP family transporter
MALVVATTTGLVIWIVLWAIGFKAFDAFLITLVIVLLTSVARSLTPHLPGRRQG